jgi:hypothetical protein
MYRQHEIDVMLLFLQRADFERFAELGVHRSSMFFIKNYDCHRGTARDVEVDRLSTRVLQEVLTRAKQRVNYLVGAARERIPDRTCNVFIIRYSCIVLTFRQFRCTYRGYAGAAGGPHARQAEGQLPGGYSHLPHGKDNLSSKLLDGARDVPSSNPG